MELRQQIDTQQIALNSAEVLPKFAYRRNSPVYPLVCSVNHTICCLTSQHLQPIPILLERIKQFMDEHPNLPEAESYYSLVAAYITNVERYLVENGVSLP